ncbi:MAG: proline--tRNA ligase [Candidatus Rokubacteria bacterium]|nr:proline--tRNA ligase [Candidatus Rokubacteria bacterium]
MRWARSLIPTLREDPADAEAVSHKLMVRAGLVRQLAAGIYVYLPLGQRVLDKISAIIREEMNRIGGQEITMPVLHPAEIWQETGRWQAIGDEMFRLKDRNARDMCLGMTHEEVIAWLASKELRSYRDLPQIWYQIQTKERDEARPRSGVLRTREFLMKDSYTLDLDEAGLAKAYDAHKEAYCRIFDRCGLRYHVVESDPGMMGGSGSHEFMAPSAAGEDEVALCERCGYAANVELARGVPARPRFPDWTLQEVPTPNARTIAEVAALLKVEPTLTIKSLLYVAKDGPVLALVRGDQALHEKKLVRVVGEFRPAHPDEVKAHLGAPVGSVGPVNVKLPIIADESLSEGVYVVGANKEGFHLKGARPGKDFSPRFADLHVVQTGEGCAQCGSPLKVERVIEVGNIFKLGTKYSVPLRAVVLDESGQERPIVMGSYGIGPARIAAAAVEQRHDADGIIWPWSIAPFHVHPLAVNQKDPAQGGVAEELYEELVAAGVEVVYDDRDERPGVKFKDADLIGLPIRVTVGNAYVKEGVVEVRSRRNRTDRRVPRRDVVVTVKELAQELRGG